MISNLSREQTYRVSLHRKQYLFKWLRTRVELVMYECSHARLSLLITYSYLTFHDNSISLPQCNAIAMAAVAMQWAFTLAPTIDTCDKVPPQIHTL